MRNGGLYGLYSPHFAATGVSCAASGRHNCRIVLISASGNGIIVNVTPHQLYAEQNRRHGALRILPHMERMDSMKLNSGFITHNDGDDTLLVSTGETDFSGLVRSNPTAGFIIGCLEQETTEDEIIAKMQQKWEVSDEIARRDVRRIVEQLRGIGAIDG